jgi:hydroxypyruvate isomerase
VLLVKKIDSLAEKHGVVLMELLNSKINHPDYQCNSTLGSSISKTIKFRSFQAIV